MLDRRELLGKTAKASVGWVLAPAWRAMGAEQEVVMLRPGNARPVPLAANFTGLGYEMSSVATPGLLSARNGRYVRLVKGLGAEGVIRAGGIVADYSSYEGAGTPVAQPKRTVLTRASLEEFGGFLRATGWRAIWSLNLAQGTMDSAVIEARAVAEVLGERLLALELGNEVENYGKGDRPFRPATWGYEAYRAEYSRWRSAILRAAPGVAFAAPDTASSVEWVERMAWDARGDVQLLTTHYYRGGQKNGTAEQLLTPDAHLREAVERLTAAAKASGIPWRMCETNSFFGGGRPGVSDTFLGALWTLDYMLLLAAGGCAGVNLETGVNQLGFVSSYSPIQDDGHGVNRAGVPYYGMLAFGTARAGCTEIAAIEVPEAAVGLTGYALGSGGRTRSVVLVNRGEGDLLVSVAGLGLKRAAAMRLLAPSLSSVTGMTFEGSAVGADGSWSAGGAEGIEGGRVWVPKGSAVVLRGA